jgi:hypothetical protein
MDSNIKRRAAAGSNKFDQQMLEIESEGSQDQSIDKRLQLYKNLRN